MTRTVLCVAAAIALGLLPPAHARSLAQPPAWEAPGLAEAVDGILSEPELREALEAAGYSDVHTLRDDGDTYELIAQKDGSSVLLRVNARTRRYSEGPADY
jgi:hypothetical protein